jgi:hypothetical protein
MPPAPLERPRRHIAERRHRHQYLVKHSQIHRGLLFGFDGMMGDRQILVLGRLNHRRNPSRWVPYRYLVSWHEQVDQQV